MTPETYLFKEGFRGDVYVVYGVQNGEDEKMEEGRRLYEIPESGVLFTKFKQEFGTMDQKYYYVDSVGKRTELKELDSRYFDEGFKDWKKEHPMPPKGEVFIINPGFTGSSASFDTGHQTKYEFMSLTVGTFNEGYTTPGETYNLHNRLDSLYKVQIKK